MKRWIAFLLAAVLAACMKQKITYDRETSLHAAVLSDLHFTVNPRGISSVIPSMLYCREFTEAVLQEVIAARPDVLILAGDNTNAGSPGDMEALSSLLQSVKDAGIPIVMIPGNHDFNLSEPAVYEGVFEAVCEQQVRDPSSLSYRTDINGVRLLAMDDSSQDPGMSGFYSRQTIAWVKEQLEDAKEKKMRVIFLTHHPLLSSLSGQENSSRKQMADLLRQYDVRLILSGHTHSEALLQNGTLNEIVLGMPLSGNHDIGFLNLEDGWLHYSAEPADLSRYGSVELETKMKESDLLYEERLSQAFEEILDKEGITGRERQEILRLSRQFMKDYSLGRIQKTASEIRNDPYCRRMIEVFGKYNYGPWMDSVLKNPPQNGRNAAFEW